MKRSEMPPLEAAEKLKWNAEHMFCNENLDDRESANACNTAASLLCAIAAGKYKQVVHAHWEQKDCSKWPVCSNCGKPTLSCGYCPVRSNYCPSCGALMDGKDDNHA